MKEGVLAPNPSSRTRDTRIDLLDLNPEDLRQMTRAWGEPDFRARQIQRWIYHELMDQPGRMANLPHSLRERLANETVTGTLEPVLQQVSSDGLTRKVLFRLADGQTVETVLMLYADAPNSPELADGGERSGETRRRTLCISTQVGCPIGCPFCATGQAGFVRNLTVGEIVGQVLHFARELNREEKGELPLTNIVVMGMGEPLMKFDVTWRAVEALNDPSRFGLGARRLTVSTSGMVPGILRMSESRPQINLAVSLHAANDSLRNTLVPLNRRYPLEKLMDACRLYVERTNRRITFEYALMDGINDLPEDAHALKHLVGSMLCHVNLIPLNPTSESPFERSPYERVKVFERILRESGIPTTLRVEKGIKIAAGCGQLRQDAGASRRVHIQSGETASIKQVGDRDPATREQRPARLKTIS